MADWISMATPPEETGNYLCALRPVLGKVDIVIMGWAPWPDCRGWYVQDARGNVKPHKGLPVTHWMPLPEDPDTPLPRGVCRAKITVFRPPPDRLSSRF